MKSQISKLKSQNLTKQKLSPKEIDHLTKLANLPLTVEERENLREDLIQILGYVEKLNEVGTEKIIPTAHSAGLENVMRQDETEPSLSQDKALSNSPTVENGFISSETNLFIKIKAIFE